MNSRTNNVNAILEGLNESRIDEINRAALNMQNHLSKSGHSYKNNSLGPKFSLKGAVDNIKYKHEQKKKDKAEQKAYAEKHARSEEEREYEVKYIIEYYEWNVEEYGEYSKEKAEEKYSYHNWHIVKTERKTKIVKGHSVAEVEDEVRAEFKELNPSGTCPEKYAEYNLISVNLKKD